MTLTQQFIVVSIFPLSFLLMIAYVWRSEVKQRPLLMRWSLTLVVAAIWASSLLRLYGGLAFTPAIIFTWQVAGNYALNLMALGVLLTTVTYLSTPHERSLLVIGVSGLFIVFSLVIDPNIWGKYIPDFTLANQNIRHFDLWAAVWIVSWLLPLLSAWLVTRQVSTSLPLSLYRNKISYWSLMLFLLFGGGALASVQQPNQPAWQELGLLFILPAMLLGTISIARSQLPDLQLALRQILRRLSGTLIIFGLTWVALWFITERLEEIPLAISPNLLLVLAAALFAGMFTLTYRLVNDVTRRLFLPSAAQQAVVMTDYANIVGYLPEPKQLGRLFLGVIGSNIAVPEMWLLITESGPGGQLILRPLTHIGSAPPATITFASDSPFAAYLHKSTLPLVQYDIDILRDFAHMSADEKEMVASWQRVVYMPLRAGDSLIGVLALGAKKLGELYSQADFQMMQSLVIQFGPLLAQSRNLDSLLQVNEHVFQQNQRLSQDKQHLQTLAELYGQFMQHISPDLKRPFRTLSEQLSRLRSKTEDAAVQNEITAIEQQLVQTQMPLDKLINTAAHLQNRAQFNFDTVQLDEIARKVQRQLNNMANARRVRMELETGTSLSPILADAEQLTEAVRHVIHNAIKFNKIGGVVTITCGTAGSEVFLRVLDTGVGIPEERLTSIWEGFATTYNNETEHGRKANLGLTLTHFIVTAHGGRVEAESKYGSGSKFSIYLPLLLKE
ncbi:MAG: hypothetical protein KC413_23875 [Anaerolineales bacterium]|nr:hypothetical protein [Anaerolineales bacterium]